MTLLWEIKCRFATIIRYYASINKHTRLNNEQETEILEIHIENSLTLFAEMSCNLLFSENVPCNYERTVRKTDRLNEINMGCERETSVRGETFASAFPIESYTSDRFT